MSTIAERIRDNLPEFYGDTVVKIVTAISNELNIINTNVIRINNMDNIDTTEGRDLYARWGALLNIPRAVNESDDSYRSRLKLSVVALSGGTNEAIRYSIAVGLGINEDPIAMNRMIKIYDAWEYPDQNASIDRGYGNAVCDIDLNHGSYSEEFNDIIHASIESVKASGINVQLIFSNYRLYIYAELNNVVYSALGGIEYNKLGE